MEHSHRLRQLAALGPEGIAAAALSAFGAIALAVTAVAVVESYSNLLAFARVHHLTGWRLAMAPLAVDSFIIMGELLLFAALLRRWDSKMPYWLGGALAAWGFLISVGGNVWHVPSASPVDKSLGAIWPITATAGIAGGLLIIKYVMAGRDAGKAVDGPSRQLTIANDNTAGSSMNGRGAGTTVAPVTAVKTPPPAPRNREREPRQAVPGRAARAAGLAAASDREREIVLRLVAGGLPLPGIQRLAKAEHIGSPKAQRILAAARAGMNGAGDGRSDGS
jgi:hypothetical protein